MKKIFKNTLLLFLTCLVLGSSLTVSAAEMNKEKAFMKKYDKTVSKMCDDMLKVEKCGDARINYFKSMKHYKDGSVCLSEAIIKYSDCDEVKKLAEAIMKSDKDDIEIIDKMLKSLESNKQVDKEKEIEYMKVYECVTKHMCDKLCKIKDSNECIDKKYLYAMIAHHEEGLNFAKNMLRLNNNDESCKLVKEIACKQEEQLKALKNVLNDLSK